MNSNVIAMKPNQPVLGNRKLAPKEALWVHQAEMDALQLTGDWQGKASRLRAEVNRLDHALTHTLTEYVNADRKHRDKGYAGFHPKYPKALYWPLLGLAALLETPLNHSALGLLNMDDAETWMVAACVGLLNVLGASLIGWRARQAQGLRSGGRDWMVIGITLLVALTLMMGLSGLRVDDVAQRVADDGVTMSSWGFPAFLAMQLLFFVVGGFLSFSMHPADEELERVLKDKAKLRRELDGLLQRRANLAAQHDEGRALTQSALFKLREECLAKMAEYRDYNLCARQDPPPSWLRTGLDLALFAPLELGRALDASPATLDELIHHAKEAADASK